MTPTLTMVPLHAHPPRPSTTAQTAMLQMEQAVTTAGYTPLVDAAGWSIDARLYTRRAWEQGSPVGIGAPVAAVCLRLHQPTHDRLEWVAEFPARTPSAWEMPDPTRSTRRLAILGDATLGVHPMDLCLVDYLVNQIREGHT